MAQHGSAQGEDFAWTRVEPVEGALYTDDFSMFLVQVKSESDIGKRLLAEPLEVLREEIPEAGLTEDSQATVLRVNAERQVFRVHRSELWIVFPAEPSSASKRTAVGIQYKYAEDRG